MSECLNTELRDLLPDVAAERLSGSERARVAAHLASCESCAAEVELLRAARRVMSQGVPVLDVARIVAALPKPPVVAEAKPVLVASSNVRSVGARRVVGTSGGRGTPRRWLGDVLGGGSRWTAWRIAAVATVAVGGLSVAVIRHLGPVQPTGVSELPPSVVAPAATPVPSSTSPASAAPQSPEPSATNGSSAGPVVASATPDSEVAMNSGPGLAVASDISELSDGEVESLLKDMNDLDAQPSADPDDAAPGLPAVVSP
jgi:hypothetical protein